MWKRLSPAWAGTIIFAAGIVMLTVVFTAPSRPCSDAHPCAPQAIGSLVAGALLTLPLLGWVWLRLAAYTAAGVELASIAHDLLNPDDLSGTAFHLVVIGFAALCFLLAWKVRQRPPKRRPLPWQFAMAWILMGAACVLIGLTGYLQYQADARMRSATVTPVTVESTPDGFTIHVSTGQDIDVSDSGSYPVGSEVKLATDDQGLHQLVAEPYDATAWLALAAALALFGAGFWWRFTAAAKAPDLATPPPSAMARVPAVGRPRERDMSEGWPMLRAVEIAIAVIVIMAFAIAGIALREKTMVAIINGTCDDTGCSPALLASIGWAAVAVPMFALALVTVFAKRSMLTVWATIVAVGVLSFGLGSLFYGKGSSASDQRGAFFAAHPDAWTVYSGLLVAMVALFAGVVLGRAIFGKGARASVWGQGDVLLVIAALELVALPVAIAIAQR